MMHCDVTFLEELRPVANLGEIVARIELTASRFTPYMRNAGLALPGSGRVPLQSEVDNYLRRLVANAYEGLLQAMREAPAQAPDLQVEGYDSDEVYFDVVVQTVPAKIGHLSLTIGFRG